MCLDSDGIKISKIFHVGKTVYAKGAGMEHQRSRDNSTCPGDGKGHDKMSFKLARNIGWGQATEDFPKLGVGSAS